MAAGSAERLFVHPDEALKIILNTVRVLPFEDREIAQAIDHVLAQDVAAGCDLPPFDNSAMDGYAVRARDLRGARPEAPVRLKMRATLRAGQLGNIELQPGEAVKIMTGAPVPRGADAVVMREFSRQTDAGVELMLDPEPGDHIRRHGGDVRAGQALLREGCVLRAYEISMLAAQGITKVRVVRKPRVAVATSGDELVHYSEEPGPGMIRNSNDPALAALLRRWGCEPIACAIAPDDKDKIRELIADALRRADILLITGGVSVGDFDFTRAALDELGFEAVLWKVAQKPGKPLLFGTCGGKPVFGIPGNPVSALVCTEELVRPALERMQGQMSGPPSYHLRGKLVNAYAKPKDRRQYVFCRARRRDGEFLLEVIRPQGSAMLGMACSANALAKAPIGITRLEPGMELEFRWLK